MEADRPVAVLFYNNLGTDGSMGNATLLKHIHAKFGDKIKVCAYKITDKSYNTNLHLDKLKSLYPIQKSPSILFYDNDSGKLEYFDDLSVIGGIKDIKTLKQYIPIFDSEIPKQILD
jgi:hypothetical protein